MHPVSRPRNINLTIKNQEVITSFLVFFDLHNLV